MLARESELLERIFSGLGINPINARKEIAQRFILRYDRRRHSFLMRDL
jgi:hypothetical protein